PASAPQPSASPSASDAAKPDLPPTGANTAALGIIGAMLVLAGAGALAMRPRQTR
ncbi:MAG: LPXTG cell wall anchor domain-containing protein, partial [bacterium]|nr:LPXTG cell wall anchor domain-containing protein [bacterium]